MKVVMLRWPNALSEKAVGEFVDSSELGEEVATCVRGTAAFYGPYGRASESRSEPYALGFKSQLCDSGAEEKKQEKTTLYT